MPVARAHINTRSFCGDLFLIAPRSPSDETETVGHVALLPDGQPVRIETVRDDGYATVRRIDGEWSGMIAVCALDKLESIVNHAER